MVHIQKLTKMFKDKFEFLKKQKELQENQKISLEQSRKDFLWLSIQPLLQWTLHVHHQGYRKNHLGLCKLPFIGNISDEKYLEDAHGYIYLFAFNDDKYIHTLPLSVRYLDISVDNNLKLSIRANIYKDDVETDKHFASIEEAVDFLTMVTLDECEIYSEES